jgi:caffeoyl-CoA O-methyltransferase
VSPGDKATLALLEYNKKVHEDPRVENLLLPLRDGLMICRKKE